MKKITFNVFVIRSLYVTEIKQYIDENYSSFPIIHLTIDYDKNIDFHRLIVEMKSDNSSSYVISLRSEWLDARRLLNEFLNLKHYIHQVNERPF